MIMQTTMTEAPANYFSQATSEVAAMKMKKIVVLGATSGIAVEVQRQLARQGCELLLVARSQQRLAELQADLMIRGARQVLTYAADLASIQQHAGIFGFVRLHFPDFDTVLLTYGSMRDQKESEASIDALLEELQVNFVSASAILSLFAADLEQRRTGCLAAIASVAGDRGRRSNYVYGSAKGALSLFMQGLRSRLHPAGVRVITIKPGPVRTAMTDHMPNATRFADPELVARDIVRALERRSPDVLYTPKIWRYVMAAVEHIPEVVFKRLSF
jgi:decaprenylphospho-beta-D-erythro-pentofuranosid-2-ulose 2-reductase